MSNIALAMVRKFGDPLAIHFDTIRWARRLGVDIGDRCRLIGVTRSTFGAEPYLVRLGDHVTVTEGVRFVTHDGGVWIFRDKEPTLDVVAPIRVGNNVFLGMQAILLPGIHVGDNSVVGAGSVVTRDVPADCVVGGVPAQRIKSTRAYRESLHGRELNTKGFSRTQKRRFLLEKFFPSGEDGQSAR